MTSRYRTALLLLAAFLALAAPILPAAETPVASPFTPALFPSLTPAQALALQEAVRKGEFTPEARRIAESNPEVRMYLPAKWREELEAGMGAAGSTDNAAKSQTDRGAGRDAAQGESPPPYDWRKSVYVSRLFLSRLGRAESEQLVHFGFGPAGLRPDIPLAGDSAPVADEYLVGPGDEIVVRLWGRMEGGHRMRVDRDGKIFFPKLGAMSVAGKTFGEVRSLIRGRLSVTPGVMSDITLGDFKGFQVSVLGEVGAPGRYQVSSFHTVLQAIAMAGGVKDIGSLRRVQVRRGGETAQEVDVYDFLLRGDISSDIRMRAGDAVFVPVSGPLVAVAGDVRRQAIYELKGEKTVGDVLAMAGGLSPTAYGRRLQVERLEGNRARVVLDLDLGAASEALSAFDVRDGDIVRVLSVLEEEENVVRVDGNVKRPGKYEWKPGLSVGSLIPGEEFLLPDTFLDYALITRFVGPERREEAVPVSLRRIVVDRDFASDVPLKPMDALMVYSRSAFRDAATAVAGGEVRNPGMYEILPGMRVSDLVKLAGDLTPNASLDEAELSRVDEKREATVVKIHLGKALSGDASHDLPVRQGDHLMVRPVPDFQEIRYLTLAGEVRSPGVYAARKGERLSSVLERAGGFTKDASLKGAVYTRVSVQRRQQEVIDHTVDELEQEVARFAAKEGVTALDREDVEAQKQVYEARKALLLKLRQARARGRLILRLSGPETLKGTENDLLVEHGDRLEVPRSEEVVNVVGRVYNPTALVYSRDGDTVAYYLRKVGGPTEDADREHIFVVKADGSVVTKDNAEDGVWLFGGGGGLMHNRVEAGDSIVVPEKLFYPRLMKDVKDITQILYQIAVTAGVLIVAF